MSGTELDRKIEATVKNLDVWSKYLTDEIAKSHPDIGNIRSYQQLISKTVVKLDSLTPEPYQNWTHLKGEFNV